MQSNIDQPLSDQPLVSVIIPTYNRRGLIAQSIFSVLNQTYQNVELIIADDGSTDGTDELIRSISSSIHYLWQPHAGVAAARNRGLAAARGELIAFQDSDDLWHPEKLARQVDFLERHPATGMVYTSFRIIDDHSKVIGSCWRPLHSGRVTEPLFQSMFIIMPSTVVRRSVVDRVGRFSTDLCISSDYEFWLRASLAAEFAVLEEKLVDQRQSSCSLTSAKGRGMSLQYHMLLRFYEELGGQEAVRPAVARRALAKWALRAGKSLRKEGRWAAAAVMYAKSCRHHWSWAAAASLLRAEFHRLWPVRGGRRLPDFPWPIVLSPLSQSK
jgi:glycosyltransferase involved in cell wall biosynthesis